MTACASLACVSWVSLENKLNASCQDEMKYPEAPHREITTRTALPTLKKKKQQQQRKKPLLVPHKNIQFNSFNSGQDTADQLAWIELIPILLHSHNTETLTHSQICWLAAECQFYPISQSCTWTLSFLSRCFLLTLAMMQIDEHAQLNNLHFLKY